MLRDARRLAVPELDAFHTQLDVRTPSLRVGFQRGKHVASDYALLQRAAPFIHHLRRPQLVVIFEGHGRFDEDGRRVWLEPGALTLSDATVGGTDAFGGTSSYHLVLDWDPAVMGAPFNGGVRLGQVSRRDAARLERATRGLAGPRPEDAVIDLLAQLRALGFTFAPIRRESLAPDGSDARIYAEVSARLSDLEHHPAIGEVADALGATERHIHRTLAAIGRRYAFPWAHWRNALHHTRLLQAMRLLAAPGATTDRVARLTGFRAPAALCHAFDRGGLPSPGALARAARADALARWGELP